jgi:antitoxin VapB
MNKLLTADQLAPQRQTTTVFTSGNSQAVRLPKAFRFNSKTVQIERRGDEIVLREKPVMVKDVIGHLLPLSKADALEWERIAAMIDDPLPQQRDWDALLGPEQSARPAVKPKPSSRRRKASTP